MADKKISEENLYWQNLSKKRVDTARLNRPPERESTSLLVMTQKPIAKSSSGTLKSFIDFET